MYFADDLASEMIGYLLLGGGCDMTHAVIGSVTFAAYSKNS